MLKLASIILAVAFIIIGAVTLPLPIPIGLILLTLGMAILISTSQLARVSIIRLRKRYGRFNAIMLKAEQLTPTIITKILHKTAPYRKKRRHNNKA